MRPLASHLARHSTPLPHHCAARSQNGQICEAAVEGEGGVRALPQVPCLLRRPKPVLALCGQGMGLRPRHLHQVTLMHNSIAFLLSQSQLPEFPRIFPHLPSFARFSQFSYFFSIASLILLASASPARLVTRVGRPTRSATATASPPAPSARPSPSIASTASANDVDLNKVSIYTIFRGVISQASFPL